MSFRPPYRYITASNLATLLSAKPSPITAKRIAIIDVRDDDFEGGNIVGCTNIPSSQFDSRVVELVQQLEDTRTVVFHCSLSQQRGPKSARIYTEARREALSRGEVRPLDGESESDGGQAFDVGDADADAESKSEGGQQVLVLRDGFANFGRVYKDDPALVEKYDVEAWQWR